MSAARPGMVQGGKSVYGVSVGVMLLDTTIPRPPGDVGNARTFDFPVLYDTVPGASTGLAVERSASGLLERFVDVGRDLVRRGARALSTSCGFLSIHQREMTAKVDAFVATSSLLQIPMLLKMVGQNSHLGVITANASTLSSEHLAGAGITEDDRSRLAFIGLEETAHFYPIIVGGIDAPLDTDLAESEVVAAAEKALIDDPAIRGFVLECANLPPYSGAIRRATGLPVWDITTMLNWIDAAM